MFAATGAAILVLALAAGVVDSVGDGQKGQPLKQLMPWYHTGDEIRSQMSDLLSSCAQLGIHAEMTDGGANLDVLHIKHKYSSTVAKALFVFGEHARELISPESALGLVDSLCGRGANAQFAEQTLKKGVEFIIVPNANPKSRKHVEDGYYCKRTNENGVDLNRNWGDAHRSKGADGGSEDNPGPHGFSEPETRALRDLVGQEEPDVYLTVHSGFYMLGSVYGYKHGAQPDEPLMDKVLKPISEKYCNNGCPYGGLADMLGYKAAGCDIDYIKENQGVKYAFAWEIYAGPSIRDNFISRGQAQATGGEMSEGAKLYFGIQALSFLQRQSGRALRGKMQARLTPLAEDEEDPNNCIEQFNPTTEQETKQVVSTWTGAYLDLASRIADWKASGEPEVDSNSTSASDAVGNNTGDSIVAKMMSITSPASPTTGPTLQSPAAPQQLELASTESDVKLAEAPAYDIPVQQSYMTPLLDLVPIVQAPPSDIETSTQTPVYNYVATSVHATSDEVDARAETAKMANLLSES